MKVKEVMSSELKGIRADATLPNAAEQMRMLDVGSLPVVSSEDRRVIGMITDRDIVVRSVARGEDLSGQTVGDVMSTPLVCCHEADEVEEASTAMKAKQVRRVLVLNEKDQPVGMVALADLATSQLDQSEIGSVVRHLSTPPAS